MRYAMTGIRTRIDIPHFDFWKSMCDDRSDESPVKQEGNWIEVEEKEPGVFALVDNNLTVKDGNWVFNSTALGFCQWDGDVENLDVGDNNEPKYIDMSEHIKWQDVDLTPDEYRAPSIERLKEAFNHVTICAWCMGDC